MQVDTMSCFQLIFVICQDDSIFSHITKVSVWFWTKTKKIALSCGVVGYDKIFARKEGLNMSKNVNAHRPCLVNNSFDESNSLNSQYDDFCPICCLPNSAPTV